MRKDIPAKYLQINRSLKEQAKAFKDSPFNSSLQTTDPRLQPRSSFGRATFYLREEKSLTYVVSSSMLLRWCMLGNAWEYANKRSVKLVQLQRAI